jgi:hypothetical protein
MSRSFVARIQAVLDASFDPALVGKGRDFVRANKGNLKRATDYGRLRVMAVLRVENPALWERFALAKRDLHDSIATGTHGEVPRIPRVVTDADADAIDPRLGIDRDLNETLLWHGTSGSAAVDAIARTGLDTRVSSSGMQGVGHYFGGAGKADEYTQPVPSRDYARCMFLCRVLMGHPFVSTGSLEGLRRPPCREGHTGACEHPRFHSVYAPVRGAAFPRAQLTINPEYVVYEDAATYPAYMVLYHRVR